MKIINICNRVIEYSFYLLFFLVPIVVTSETSELFEFNKLWLTFGMTIIVGAAWFTKMIVKKQFKLQRTPLDIPIALFLLSQIISTIFSMDVHTSIWGYYTRFNGGLLSIIAYIFLFYAFVTNLNSIHHVKKILGVSLASALFVSIWGLPSHFGYDPTCLIFRGALDVSCWTADFQPKIRIFSTLGQPDWLGAYLAILLPLSIVYFLRSIKIGKKLISLKSVGFFFLSVLLYLDLFYTRSRSSILAIIISLTVFAGIFLWLKRAEIKKISVVKFVKAQSHVFLLVSAFILVPFFVGTSFAQLESFTFNGIRSSLVKPKVEDKKPAKAPQAEETVHFGEMGGTDSTKIRLIVWKGAIEAWKNNPIFGTGLETFAFAYYKYRPPAHNLTSEWNFLYNKAHNEYLNYLATTGLLGLGTYVSIILLFLWTMFSKGLKKLKLKEINLEILIATALVIGYLSILITNFFGFSVVIVNLYFYLIPAFCLIILGLINDKKVFSFSFKKSDIKVSKGKNFKEDLYKTSGLQKFGMLAVLVTGIYLAYTLYNYWMADKAYALGSNLDRASQYQQGYQNLKVATALRPSEPTFQDELAINNAVLSLMVLQQQKDSTGSAGLANQLAQEAITLTNKVTTEHPGNIVFAKTKVRVFYTLAQANPQYLAMALQAIEKAATLAPTDANISYNLGVLYGQNGQTQKAIETLEKTTKLKPNYRDAYYGLAIFYHQSAINKEGNVVNKDLNQKAIDEMKFILKNLAPGDVQAKQAIETWEKQ